MEDQEGWNHCDDWTDGEAEISCHNYDLDADHDTRDEATKCEECEYITPPTSSDSLSGGSEDKP